MSKSNEQGSKERELKEFFYSSLHAFFETEQGKFVRERMEVTLTQPVWMPGMEQDQMLILEGTRHYVRELLEGVDELKQ